MILEARKLAKLGFYVFPCEGKFPAIENFPECATQLPKRIRSFWTCPLMDWEQPFNIGIATSRFGDNKALLVVDVDNKNGKKGAETIIQLEISGRDLPPTLTQTTPSGGYHLIYWVDEPVKQGVNVLGDGVDIRSKGGYILAAPSEIHGKRYQWKSNLEKAVIEKAPVWLVEACGKPAERKEKKPPPQKINQRVAMERAIEYLKTAEPAIEGAGGDAHTFKVACKLKDFGLSQDGILEAMVDHWNDSCAPPWSVPELERKIENAYHYSHESVGSKSPEAEFQPIETKEKTVLDPIEKLNEKFAYLTSGGKSRILFETTDERGLFTTQHLATNTFHDKLASEFIDTGKGKPQLLSRVWFSSPKRRSYQGVCFDPQNKNRPEYFNLWRGFSIEPAKPGEVLPAEAKKGFNRFIDHTFENVCRGDQELYLWLMTYLAHLIQKPWEKPLTALVFKGKKGVGKNALIDRIGALLGPHYMVTADRRYLMGNFNSPLEKLLLFVLDEAFWSGDKQAEGVVKNLITGNRHVIERKGEEPYSVQNLLRLVIIGNEDWLASASHDERRFAVFDVGEGKKQNTRYFHEMRDWIDNKGGNRLLLKYLREWDLSETDINIIPENGALLSQKLESLSPRRNWWLSCIIDGKILGSVDPNDPWPEMIDRGELIASCKRWVKDRYLKYYERDMTFSRDLREMCPSMEVKRARIEGSLGRVISLPSLESARKEFETFIGHEIDWENT